MSSGDISDALDLVDTPGGDPEDFPSNHNTDHYLKSRLSTSASNPYSKQSNGGVYGTPDNMRDRNTGTLIMWWRSGFCKLNG